MNLWLLRTYEFFALFFYVTLALFLIAKIGVSLYNVIHFWWVRRQIDHETRAAVQLQREQERRLAAVISITERRSAR